MADEKPKSEVKAKVEEKPARVEEKPRSVYRRNFVIPADAETGDCSNAVRQEAINLGLRPNGEASVEKTEKTANGRRKVVTWVIPVEGKK